MRVYWICNGCGQMIETAPDSTPPLRCDHGCEEVYPQVKMEEYAMLPIEEYRDLLSWKQLWNPPTET